MPKRLASLFIASILLLSGCAQIPSDSIVQTGTDIESSLTTDYTYYLPNPPVEGDGQSEILNGFLNAMTGPQNDYEVARQFLVGSLASTWNPNTRLLIETTRPSIDYFGTNQARVSVTYGAELDALGHYQRLNTPKTETLLYTFAQEDGEWRIAQAPDVTLLVRPVFEVLFKSYNLYFYDRQSRYLVPDLRWFPNRQSTSTRLISALLEGPSPWLSEAAFSTFPNSTKLALDSVLVSNGTAVVDLNSVAAKATADQLQHMLAQVTATLTQVAGIYSAVIRIEHIPQQVSELPYRLALNTSSIPFMLSQQGIEPLNGQNPIEKITESAKALPIVDFSINNQNTLAAVLSLNGVSLIKNYGTSQRALTIDTRAGLLRPAIDPQGYIFTLGSGANASLAAFDETGKKVMTQTAWLAGSEHEAFAISREGTRVAVVLRKAGHTKLVVATIIRDYQGKPVKLSAPHEVSSDQIIGSGINWSGENAVSVVTLSDDGLTTPKLFTIGGDVEVLPPLVNARELVASGSSATRWAIDMTGQVWQLRGYNWIKLQEGISQLHF